MRGMKSHFMFLETEVKSKTFESAVHAVCCHTEERNENSEFCSMAHIKAISSSHQVFLLS